MKIIFMTIFVLSLSFGSVYAQSSSQADIKNIEQGKIQFFSSRSTSYYNNEFNVGGRLNSNGWNIYFELGKKRNDSVRNIYQFEIGETKSQKGNKNSRTHLYNQGNYTRRESGQRFVYGKKNIFYQVRLGYGRRRTIGTKGNKNGVEVSAIYMGGISIGLLRPYYLQLLDSSGAGSYYAKFTPDNAADFLNINNIIQGSGLKHGWNEMKIDPGVYARLGMRFDWAEYNEFVSAVEVGITGSYYMKDAQIMVRNEGKQFFYSAYISILFGKRW